MLSDILYVLCGYFVKCRVKGIEVAAVQMVLNVPEGFTKALEVNDFPFPQEADGIADIVVFDHAEDVVVGGAGFLLCRQIFKKICDGIAFRLKFTGVKGDTACCLRPDTGGMINIVGAKAGFFYFLRS